jgi:hypothetical protein
MDNRRRRLSHSGQVWLITNRWAILDDALKATAGGKVCFIWSGTSLSGYLGAYRKIGDARAYDDLLDDRSRHHRIDPRRGRNPHVFAPGQRTISSRWPHFFHVGRNPDSLHLLQAEDSFSPGQPLLATRLHFAFRERGHVSGSGLLQTGVTLKTAPSGSTSVMAMLQQPEQNELISWCCN